TTAPPTTTAAAYPTTTTAAPPTTIAAPTTTTAAPPTTTAYPTTTTAAPPTTVTAPTTTGPPTTTTAAPPTTTAYRPLTTPDGYYNWGGWTAWGSCNGHLKWRYRYCFHFSSSRTLQVPFGYCPGTFYESSSHGCTFNWGEWSTWSSCSGITKTRQRHCYIDTSMTITTTTTRQPTTTTTPKSTTAAPTTTTTAAPTTTTASTTAGPTTTAGSTTTGPTRQPTTTSVHTANHLCQGFSQDSSINGCTNNRFTECVINLGFVLDESGSISYEEFENMVIFVKTFAQLFKTSNISLITYNSDSKLHFGFNDFASLERAELLEYLSNVSRRGGGTHTYHALEMARTRMFTPNSDNNVLIVMTDGFSVNRHLLINESNALHQDGVDVIPIGIGSHVNNTELNIMATNPSHIFNANNTFDLKGIVLSVAQTIKSTILSTSTTTTTTTVAPPDVVDLQCNPDGFKAGFLLTNFEDSYYNVTKIHFGDTSCITNDINGNINIQRQTVNGRVWVDSNFNDCGFRTYEDGFKMVHEQTVRIRSSFLQNSATFQRDFDTTYIMKCVFDRRLNETLSIFVTDRANETKEDDSVYKLGFKATEVTEFGTGKEVEGLIRIGDRLKMEINMVNTIPSVKTSPQICYATRLDGTGRKDFIKNRCSVDFGTRILSPSNAIHIFEWELVVGRFFDDSDGIKIICEVSICNNAPYGDLNEECKRCGQTSNKRKRRNIDDEKEKITKETATRTFYIIDKDSPSPTSAPGTGFAEKPEGITVIILSALLILLCVVLVKKMFFGAKRRNEKNKTDMIELERGTNE
uniref:Uncharacterized protein n=2 Tax=Clytia hemisphaerica TaxID=252671 RepID=A0A7M5WTV1_9CNID